VTVILDKEPGTRQGADAFTVLGLPYSPDLTDTEVRAAYLLRLRATHPDNGGDAGAAAAVTEAYDALRSGVRRGELLSAATVDREGPPREPSRPPSWWGRQRAARPVRAASAGGRAGDGPDAGPGQAGRAAASGGSVAGSAGATAVHH
jgi:curved DNA-binding protein CbpA